MTVNSPRGENAFCKAVFTRTAHVIHHFVPAILDDGFANTLGDGVERFIPGRLIPLSRASFASAFEWIKNAIGISYLVECCRTFGAVTPTRSGMLRIALKLLNFASDLVDVSEQPARGFAVKASGGNDRVMPLLARRPRARIQFRPIIPTFLRRKRRKMAPTRTRVEGFFGVL